MKLLRREPYMKLLADVSETPDIKVITGVRRCGKSSLMKMFAEELLLKDSSANIIYIDMTSLDFENLREYHALNSYIEQRYIPDVRNYIFIDEVQLCSGFEYAVNSLYSGGKYNIFITGSNAFLLGNDLATLFTGRSFSIELFPFSYQEYMQYFNLDNQYTAFQNYITDGGMPGSYLYKNDSQKAAYIAEIYDTLIVRDIQQKYGIRNIDMLNRISDYLMDNISNLTSARGIANILAAETKDAKQANGNTIGNYINCLCNAFAFYKVRRYDIKGKRWLSSTEKYYLSDHSFRSAKLGSKNADLGRIYENIVAIELLRRGYELYAGTLYDKEIDFVALRRNEKIYIQVSQTIEDETTFARETDSLLKIKDAYPKLIITRTLGAPYQYEGIQITDIADWLLARNA